MAALHTIGLSHCGKFSSRIYNFSPQMQTGPTLNTAYANQLQGMCRRIVDPRIAIPMDPIIPWAFDKQYYKSLQQGMGLFSSDQALFTDSRSRPIVDSWAQSSQTFNQAFAVAMTNLGGVGVKTGTNGNIRQNCTVLN